MRNFWVMPAGERVNIRERGGGSVWRVVEEQQWNPPKATTRRTEGLFPEGGVPELLALGVKGVGVKVQDDPGGVWGRAAVCSGRQHRRRRQANRRVWASVLAHPEICFLLFHSTAGLKMSGWRHFVGFLASREFRSHRCARRSLDSGIHVRSSVDIVTRYTGSTCI